MTGDRKGGRYEIRDRYRRDGRIKGRRLGTGKVAEYSGDRRVKERWQGIGKVGWYKRGGRKQERWQSTGEVTGYRRGARAREKWQSAREVAMSRGGYRDRRGGSVQMRSHGMGEVATNSSSGREQEKLQGRTCCKGRSSGRDK